jgi:hypothetical protein
VTTAKRLFGERGMASLNHKFSISERGMFLFDALDSSGKTGGGFFAVLPVVSQRQHSGRRAPRRLIMDYRCLLLGEERKTSARGEYFRF